MKEDIIKRLYINSHITKVEMWELLRANTKTNERSQTQPKSETGNAASRQQNCRAHH